MKKIIQVTCALVLGLLIIGMSCFSRQAFANPLIEDMDDLIVIEGDLEHANIETLLVDVMAENHLNDIDKIADLIKETLSSSRTVFILNQPSHLALFLDNTIANNGDTILLGSNIDMVEFPFLSGRDYFNGTFNGNGFTISNLRIESNDQNIGFIHASEQIILENVTFENLQVEDGTRNTGGLIGVLSAFDGFGSSTIDSVNITGNSFVREGVSIGGFVGRLEGTLLHILNSNNYATVAGGWPNSSPHQIGGFVGESVRSNLYINHSENRGNVFGPNSQVGVGGFIGRAYGEYLGPSIITHSIEISNSANYGSITNNSRVAGGFIGTTSDSAFNHLEIVIEDGTNYGDITGVGRAGGIIGESFNYFSQISLNNVYNSGNVDGPGVVASGIIGRIESDRSSPAKLTLIDVSNSGNISSPYAGGIIGFMLFANVEIEGVINQGDVRGSNASVAWDAGGIIGFIAASNVEIQDATNSGMIHASNAGGILGSVVGGSNVLVTNWANSGLIIGTQNAGIDVGFVESDSTVIMSE